MVFGILGVKLGRFQKVPFCLGKLLQFTKGVGQVEVEPCFVGKVSQRFSAHILCQLPTSNAVQHDDHVAPGYSVSCL